MRRGVRSATTTAAIRQKLFALARVRCDLIPDPLADGDERVVLGEREVTHDLQDRPAAVVPRAAQAVRVHACERAEEGPPVRLEAVEGSS